MENKFKRLYSRDEQQEREEFDQPAYHYGREEREQDYTKTNTTGRRYNPERRQRQYFDEDFDTDKDDNKFRLRREMSEFRPEEVKVKLDAVYHTLTIAAKRVSQPWQAEQEKCLMRKEVIPLPETVNLEELRVKFTPRGELLVKAPYQRREDSRMSQRYQRRGEVPLPLSYKDTSSKRQQDELMPNGQVDVNKCSVQRYLRLLKNSSFPNTLSTDCIRDETTGKWKVIFDVNTVGFRREEIQVNFQEKERLLIVEAKHETRKDNQQVQGISAKTLRREFILPEYLDGKQMRYRIMNTGVLRIQLPCLRNPCPKTNEQYEEDIEQFKQKTQLPQKTQQ